MQIAFGWVITGSGDNMATQEQRTKGLETAYVNIRERLSKIEGRFEAPHKSPNTIMIAILSMLGVGMIAYLGWLGVQTVDHGEKLAVIYQVLAPQLLEKLSSSPRNLGNIDQATKILAIARQTGERIDPTIVSESGKKFVEASSATPAAWRAAKAFLDYQSLLNSTGLPEMSSPAKDLSSANYIVIPVYPGSRMPQQLNGFGTAPRDQSARLEPLGSTGTKVGETGAAIVVVEGADLTIDSMLIKNIVFRNSTIRYHGGPIQMENVYFVNCDFEVSQDQASRKFALAVLQSSPVKFGV